MDSWLSEQIALILPKCHQQSQNMVVQQVSVMLGCLMSSYPNIKTLNAFFQEQSTTDTTNNVAWVVAPVQPGPQLLFAFAITVTDASTC